MAPRPTSLISIPFTRLAADLLVCPAAVLTSVTTESANITGSSTTTLTYHICARSVPFKLLGLFAIARPWGQTEWRGGSALEWPRQSINKPYKERNSEHPTPNLEDYHWWMWPTLIQQSRDLRWRKTWTARTIYTQPESREVVTPFTWPTLNRFRNRFQTVLTLARSHGHYRRCGQLRHVVRVDYRLGVN